MASAQELQHIIILCVASVLLIVCFSAPTWKMTWKLSFIDIRSGLFIHCIEDYCAEQDGDKYVIGMEFLGILAAMFCAICMTVHHAKRKKPNNVINKLPQITFFVAIAGAVLVFLGCAKYAFDNFDMSIYPGYSFVLALIGGILLIIGGVVSYRKYKVTSSMAVECQHIILHYVASILIFVGIITPSWTTNWNSGSLKIQRGLSTICVKKICIDHDNNPEVKYLVFAGFYLSIFCDLIVTLHFILKSLSITAVKFLPKVAFVAGIIGAILIVIGSIMYAVDNFGDKKYPGYSYGFLVSGGLILMSAATASSRAS